jgi:hypothetical protein
MKNIFLLLIPFLFLFYSCEDKYPKQPDLDYDQLLIDHYNNAEKNPINKLFDKQWVLYDARLYMEKLGFNRTYRVFDYFSPSNNQYKNIMQVYSMNFPFDTIQKGYTRWFINRANSTFTLNSEKTYLIGQVNSFIFRVFPLENGSSRIFAISYNGITDNSLVVYTSSSYGSHNGDNYYWFSQLIFTAEGSTCVNCIPNSINTTNNYVYSGVFPFQEGQPPNNPEDLVGSRWVITKYRLTGLMEQNRNDTLDFYLTNMYKIINSPNPEQPYQYQLTSSVNLGVKTLRLCGLPFASSSMCWEGNVTTTSVTNGVIVEMQLTSSFNTSPSTLRLWMDRIN